MKTVKTDNDRTEKQYSFLLGYYAHLITDAAFKSLFVMKTE